MSHLALARKYRPRLFGDVAAQEHVSETLRRAVLQDLVGHAYLFCGPRGVGKTTLARVLAMALNCTARSDDAEPCGMCDSCTRIWAGHTSLDVVEIDAASNRGVDDARNLRERAMYAPSEEGRFKVYILDEAHMLTREAWNALLKILEEPPSRVIFVFATTEPQKIQQTAAPILSRCQRFDFRRIGTGEIVDRLKQVVEAEGISATDEALRQVARKANGGMRDGLSLLDQLLALSEGRLTIETVVRVLGVVAEQRYLDLFDIIVERRHVGVFDFVEGLLDEGYDLVEFYHGLTEKLRLLLRLSLDPESGKEALSADAHAAFLLRATAFAAGDLMRMLALCSELESNGSLRRTGRPRVLIEMLLLRMSYLDRTLELEALIRALGGAEEPEPPPGREEPRAPNEALAQPSTQSTTGGHGESTANELPASEESAAGHSEGVPAAPAKPARRPSKGTGGDVLAGWHALLDDPAQLPAGLKPFLRAAQVERVEGGLRLRLPSGPAHERLRELPTIRALTDGLALHSGLESVEIQLVDPGGDGQSKAGRVSEAGIRESRLQQLVEKEPILERAIEEFDLELMD